MSDRTNWKDVAYLLAWNCADEINSLYDNDVADAHSEIERAKQALAEHQSFRDFVKRLQEERPSD